MSLTLSLNSALSGLSINQKNLQVLSQNIANTNTAGYSRQVLNQSPVYLDGQGAGVTAESIMRRADDLLQKTVRDKSSDYGKSFVLSSYMEQAQILYGQPGAPGSIDQNTQSFFNNLQNLTVSPESSAAQQTAVSAGVALAQQISSLASGLENLRFQADQQIKSSLSTVNQALEALYKLNATLARAHAAGQPTGGLLDERDKNLLIVAQFINININVNESGGVQVFAGGGVPLVDTSLYRLEYTPVPSVQTFVKNTGLSALVVQKLDEAGNPGDDPVTLVPGGASGSIHSGVTSGALAGLLAVRDSVIPQALAQLDNFASVLRDEINAIQNSGSGFPGVNSLTGGRLLLGSDSNTWSGGVRIAVLDANGQPVESPYLDESETGIRPLLLDLESLNGGLGAGQPTVQSIIDAINTHFGPPQNKAELGNINNITLYSRNSSVPGNSQAFSFDFGLENISGANASFFVTGVTVTDDVPADISSVTSTIPSFNLNASGTYTTTAGSQEVVVRTQIPPSTLGLQNGDVIYLPDPGGGPHNGLSSNQLSGFFTINNITSTGFTIQVSGTPAGAGGPVNVSGATGMPPYDTLEPGENRRTGENGAITAGLGLNPFSAYYDITVQTAVVDEDGAVRAGNVSYRIYNNTNSTLNQRYSATAASSGATLVTSTGTSSAALRATLVDAQGNEIPKNASGDYGDEQGYLKLTARNGLTVALDELNSAESASGRGFSHYFSLNDFFAVNRNSATGDTVAGSAYNLAVKTGIATNPAALSTGKIILSTQPSGAGAAPDFTYRRVAGENSVAARFAALATSSVGFAAAGGLSNQSTSLVSYASAVLGSAATTARNMKDTNTNDETLLEGFQRQLRSLTGVNLDEELANTIIYQNAYAATARIITVVNQMMEDLVNVFQ